MVRQTNKDDHRTTFLISLVILMVVCLCWLMVRSMLRPRLIVSDVDIGTYIPGQTVERVIHLENKGWRSLAVHKAYVCCGMSLPDGFPKRIAPQSINSIVVHMCTPRGYTALYNKVTLKTNDPTSPVSIIAIRGKPDTSITVDPPIVDLGYVIAGDKFPSVLKIRLADNKNWPNFVSSSPQIILSSHDSSKNDAIEIDLEIAREADRYKLREYVYIKTGIPSQPNIIIPVRANVERGLRSRPEQVFFGVVKGKKVISRRISLEVIGPGWETIQVKPSPCDGINARVEQKDINRFELHVSLNPEKMPQFLKSYVTLLGMSGDTMQIPILAVRKTL
jgi:hypothetical protein